MNISGHKIEISNPKKELYSGITKQDIIDYYVKVSSLMLSHIRKRPIAMKRYPNGITSDGFYQKEAPKYFPSWITRAKVRKGSSHQDMIICNDKAAIAYLANQAVLTWHIWLSTTDNLENPDKMIFDLDPSNKDFSQVKEAARTIKKKLDSINLRSFLMTTGGKGLHIVIPIKPEHHFDKVRSFAKKLAQNVVSENPDGFTLEHRISKREGKIFIDYLRNAYAQTAVAPYSLRAKESAPIATPIGWDELSRLKSSQQYNIKNIFRRLNRKKDPWKDINRLRQKLSDIGDVR